MVMSDPNKFREKIEALDTQTLRNNLALNIYGSPEKVNIVREELRIREQRREDGVKELELSIAKDALAAAQKSAAAAQKSAKWAFWAMIFTAAMFLFTLFNRS